MDRGINPGFSSLGLCGFWFPTADVGLYRLIVLSEISTELSYHLVRISCVGYHLNLFLLHLLWTLSPFQFPPLFFSMISSIPCNPPFLSAAALCPPPSPSPVPHRDFVLWVFPREGMAAAFLLLVCCLQDFFISQAIGCTSNLLDCSNYIRNSWHPVVVWEFDLTGAAGSGLFGKGVMVQGEGLGRWRQLNSLVKKHKMSNIKWHLHGIRVNIWHPVASLAWGLQTFEQQPQICLLWKKKLHWEVMWIR